MHTFGTLDSAALQAFAFDHVQCFLHHLCSTINRPHVAVVKSLCTVAEFHPPECLPDATSDGAEEIKEGGNVRRERMDE